MDPNTLKKVRFSAPTDKGDIRQFVENNYVGLPMFKLFKPKAMDGERGGQSQLMRVSDFDLNFSSPSPFGQCYYFNPRLWRNGCSDETASSMQIETLGALETFGFNEDDKFNTSEVKKSDITLKIPKDSQTYKTIKLFERKIEEKFVKNADAFIKSGTNVTFVSSLRERKMDDSYVTLKLKIDRSKKDPEKCLVDVTKVRKVTDKSTGSHTFNVVPFEEGVEGIKSMAEVRVLMKWSGLKVLNSSKKVYHNLNLKAIQVIRMPVEDTFESDFDPEERAP